MIISFKTLFEVHSILHSLGFIYLLSRTYNMRGYLEIRLSSTLLRELFKNLKKIIKLFDRK